MQVKQILRRMFTRVYPFAIFFSTNENSCFKIADRCCQQREKQSSINAFLTILSEKFFQKFDTANVKCQQFVTTQICQSSKKGERGGGGEKIHISPFEIDSPKVVSNVLSFCTCVRTLVSNAKF